MKNHKVIPAFEMLLNEIDAAMSILNRQGAQLLKNGAYDEATDILDKLKSISNIRAHVESL